MLPQLTCKRNPGDYNADGRVEMMGKRGRQIVVLVLTMGASLFRLDKGRAEIG